MGDPHFDTQRIRQFLKPLFEYVSLRTVTAASIAKNQQFFSLGIGLLAMVFSPSRNAFVSQFARLVTGIEVHKPTIVFQVVNSVWDDRAS